jgi:hypothetical protein
MGTSDKVVHSFINFDEMKSYLEDHPSEVHDISQSVIGELMEFFEDEVESIHSIRDQQFLNHIWEQIELTGEIPDGVVVGTNEEFIGFTRP